MSRLRTAVLLVALTASVRCAFPDLLGPESEPARCPVSPITRIAITKAVTGTLLVGTDTRFSLALTPACQSPTAAIDAIWTVENPAVARLFRTVGPWTEVIALAPGSTSLRATLHGQTASASLVVPEITPVGPVVSLGAGPTVSCAIAVSGRLHCWGRDDYGSVGSVIGDSLELGRCQGVRCSPVPFLRSGIEGLDDVSVGRSHACGLQDDVAWCWGSNWQGQLGSGERGPGSGPVTVAGGNSWRAVTVGHRHSCGLDVDGRAFCWGENSTGQLGDSTKASRKSPVRVRSDARFASLSAGWGSSCGVTEEGALECWGELAVETRGDTTCFRSSGSGKSLNTVPCSWVPVGVRADPDAGADSLFRAVAVGGHFCALTLAGRALCWGSNSGGTLGVGTADSRVLRPKPVVGGMTFTAITVGRDHSCALDGGGAAYCWGENARGQLGDGSRTTRPGPTPVGGAIRFRRITAGSDHTCGLVMDGLVYCWGDYAGGSSGSGLEATVLPTRIRGQE